MPNQSRAVAADPVPSLRGSEAFRDRWGVILAGGLIALAALAAYANSFSRPFIFDDLWSIVGNPTIHHFGTAWSPPQDEGVGGRPLLNLSFALNYAISGDRVWSYHALNLAIHILAGLTLFGIVRRTLEMVGTGGPPVRAAAEAKADTDGRAARPYLLGFAIALLWTVHPLQTESVTYISQRAESLMGLFYLLTLYSFIRSLSSPTPARWQVLSVLACLLGALSKEIIATAPVMILLYDRVFGAGSFREAWQRRWRYYAGLGGAWLLLARLVSGLHQRGVGFGGGVNAWNYALTSSRSVVLYLRLALWPHPLAIDYGNHLVNRVGEILPCALVLAVLLAALAVAWRYRPAVGYAGAWFFVILAPTSTVIPVPGQPTAEHRMYLPLAAVVALVAVGLHAWLGRRSLILLATAALGLGWLTSERNTDYRDEFTIWSDAASKHPENERAHNGVGRALLDVPGRRSDAIAEFETAVRINPDYAEGHFNLGTALARTPGRAADALAEFEAATRLEPGYAEAHDSLGNILAGIPGRLPDAISEYETALRLKPDYAEAHNNLGSAWIKVPGRLSDAISEYETALRLKPDYAEAHFDLGLAWSETPGKLSDAMAEYRTAARIKPDYAEAQNNLGILLAGQPGRMPEAIACFEAAVRINPDYAEAQNNLGSVLAGQPGRLPEAIDHFEAAVRSQPGYAQAHLNLGTALAQTPGRLPDAIAELETALRLQPDLAPAREILKQLRRAPP
jgi:tetratricopeptide (TPR) repeat protein